MCIETNETNGHGLLGCPYCIYSLSKMLQKHLQASHCKQNLRTWKIFKFKDILRTSLRQHTTVGCNTHCKTIQKCTLLHLTDWIERSGSQGQGHQSMGQNNTELNFLPMYPVSTQDYLRLGLFAEGAAGCSSALCFIVSSLNAPCAFINLDCTFSLHALTLSASWLHSAYRFRCPT